MERETCEAFGIWCASTVMITYMETVWIHTHVSSRPWWLSVCLYYISAAFLLVHTDTFWSWLSLKSDAMNVLINDIVWLGLLCAFWFVSAPVNYDRLNRVTPALLAEEVVLKAAGRTRRSCVHQKDRGMKWVRHLSLQFSSTSRWLCVVVDVWAGLGFLAWFVKFLLLDV